MRVSHVSIVIAATAVTFFARLSSAAEPGGVDHRNPMVLRDANGERPVRTAEDWAARRAGVLEGMQAAMGKLPERADLPPLDVKVLREVKGEGFARQAITYVVERTDRVPAHLYVPTSPAPAQRRPAMLALHQTSNNGKGDLAGEGQNPNMGYAPELARRGYVVLCPDYPSFGDHVPYDFAADRYESGTMKGIANHMRGLDLLAARDDVDPQRIGAIGHSLGGHNAIFLAAVDERVKGTVSSCGWTPFHDYFGGKLAGWTSDRYMPRIRDVYKLDPNQVPFDFAELIAAIAPRAFLSVSPLRDDNFDVSGVKKGIAAAAPVFELLGAKDAIQARYPDIGHDFPPAEREAAFAFIDKVLGQREGADAAKPQAAEEDLSGELPRIPPTEPADALKTFQTLPGFRMELAASEPNVASPVALSFDENGRMYVCEMRDYSEQDKERLGTIRLLEDADDDGVYERSTVFADDLSWPTAVVCVGGGVYVGAAPDILWLKDTDGDGRADERAVVFTGFGRSNVQGLLNSFHWGLDNRVHGSASTSGGQVRRFGEPKGDPINLSGRDFSFDPTSLEIRPESGGGQHGMSFDDWGRKFVSANSDHIQQVVVEDRYLAGNPYLSSARISIAADGPQAEVFRISPVEPWRVVRTRLRVSGAVPGPIEGGGRPAGYFTGATGVTIYRGDAFGPEYRGQAFVGDVGSNIVHRKVLEPNGVAFVARRADAGREFVASTDTWFRPAQFANAPDGALYVIDVYREVIEHPHSLPPVIKRHLDLTSGRDRGRIWRVVPDGFNRRHVPRLGAATTAELVATLEHRNGWHRDTAARLLYERRDRDAARPLLEQLAASAEMPEARVHALYALWGLLGLSEKVLDRGLADPSPRVREHAVRLLEWNANFISSTQRYDNWHRKLIPLAADADAGVRHQVALSFSPSDDAETARVVDALLRNAADDRWLQAAALHKAATWDPVKSLETLLAKPDDMFPTSSTGRTMIASLARAVGEGNERARVTEALRIVSKHPGVAADLLGGLSEGMKSAGVSLRDRVAAEPKVRAMLDRLLDDAHKAAADAGAPAPARAAALRLLGTDSLAAGRSAFAAGLSDRAPQEVQLAALSALDRFAEPKVGAMIVKAWPGLTPAVRAAAANVVFARPDRAAAFLDAVEAGTIRPADVDRARLAALEAGDDAALAARAKKLLAASPAAGRQEVFESYRPALAMAGDPARGKVQFETTCAACHRVGDVGNEIGPNLAAMRSRGAEAILLNLIDPNREVNPQYVEYVVQTTDGRTTSGLLASETAGAITLKRAGGETETVRRADVKRMRSSGLSIMPVGLEQGIDRQGMADLIAYLMAAN